MSLKIAHRNFASGLLEKLRKKEVAASERALATLEGALINHLNSLAWDAKFGAGGRSFKVKLEFKSQNLADHEEISRIFKQHAKEFRAGREGFAVSHRCVGPTHYISYKC